MWRKTIIWLLCLLGIPFVFGARQSLAQADNLEVTAIYWSLAGDRLAVLVVDQETYESYIQIVDVQSKQVLSTLHYPATSVAWSPDGRRIAVNAYAYRSDDSFFYFENTVVTILDVQSGSEMCQIDPFIIPSGNDFRVGAVAWSPDGSKVALSTFWYAGNDTDSGTVQVWNADSCTRRAILLDDGYWSVDLGWWTHPNGILMEQNLFSVRDGRAERWNVDQLERLGSFDVFAEGSGPAVWNADGSKLAISNGEAIRILDAQTGEILASFAYLNCTLLWNAEDQLVVVGPDTMTIVDPMTGKNIEKAELPEMAIPSPDQQQAAYFDGDGIQIQPLIYVPVGQNAPAAVQIEEPDPVGTDNIGDVLWAGNTIALLGQRGIWLYDDLSQPPHLLTASSGQISHMVFSPDGRYLIFPVNDPENRDFGIRVWDVAAGEVVRVLDGHTGEVTAMDIHNDLLVTGSADQSIRVWDWSTGEQLRVLWGHGDTVLSVDISPDGSLITSSGGIRLWDMKSGEPIPIDFNKLPGQFSPFGTIIRDTQFTPDGTGIVFYYLSDRYSSAVFCFLSIGDDRLAHCVDPIGIGYPGNGPYYKVAFSPDGKQMVPYITMYLGNYQTGLGIYDVDTATALDDWWALRCAWGSGAAAFSPDGSTLATGVAENTVCDQTPFREPNSVWLWNTQTTEVKTFLHANALVDRLVFSPDGSRLLSISTDDRIQLWDVTSGAEIAAVDDFRQEEAESE